MQVEYCACVLWYFVVLKYGWLVGKVMYRIAGNIGGHKIWWICHERHLAGFNLADYGSQTPMTSHNGDFTRI